MIKVSNKVHVEWPFDPNGSVLKDVDYISVESLHNPGGRVRIYFHGYSFEVYPADMRKALENAENC